METNNGGFFACQGKHVILIVPVVLLKRLIKVLDGIAGELEPKRLIRPQAWGGSEEDGEAGKGVHTGQSPQAQHSGKDLALQALVRECSGPQGGRVNYRRSKKRTGSNPKIISKIAAVKTAGTDM